jgi:hypothetical protein
MDKDSLPVETDSFELSFRLLGNEIIAMQLSSTSTKKNWIIFGLISLVLLAFLANQLTPLLLALTPSV